MSLAVTEEPDGIVFDVQVVPRACRERLGPVLGGRLKVQLTAPPVDGAANDALVLLIARALGRGRGDVHIVRGLSGRKKTIRVTGARRADLLSQIEGS